MVFLNVANVYLVLSGVRILSPLPKYLGSSELSWEEI